MNLLQDSRLQRRHVALAPRPKAESAPSARSHLGPLPCFRARPPVGVKCQFGLGLCLGPQVVRGVKVSSRVGLSPGRRKMHKDFEAIIERLSLCTRCTHVVENPPTTLLLVAPCKFDNVDADDDLFLLLFHHNFLLADCAVCISHRSSMNCALGGASSAKKKAACLMATISSSLLSSLRLVIRSS